MLLHAWTLLLPCYPAHEGRIPHATWEMRWLKRVKGWGMEGALALAGCCKPWHGSPPYCSSDPSTHALGLGTLLPPTTPECRKHRSPAGAQQLQGRQAQPAPAV